jgi:hypothetical protein
MIRTPPAQRHAPSSTGRARYIPGLRTSRKGQDIVDRQGSLVHPGLGKTLQCKVLSSYFWSHFRRSVFETWGNDSMGGDPGLRVPLVKVGEV